MISSNIIPFKLRIKQEKQCDEFFHASPTIAARFIIKVKLGMVLDLDPTWIFLDFFLDFV